MQPHSASTTDRFLKKTDHQKGLVLFLFLLTLIAIVGVAFISISAGGGRLLQREKNAREILNQTRLSVIGFSIGAISPSGRLGNASYPDLPSGTPSKYDGKAALGCWDSSKSNGLPLVTTGATMRCLGRLPWKELGIQTRVNGDEDVLGEMPWYALSPNLVDQCLDVLNSNTVNRIYAGYVCNSSTLPHPWLIVRDSRGAILSDRAAMVFIVPGSPVAGQVRTAYPNLGGANQYLDSVSVAGNLYSNADLDNDFIVGDQTATFNDVVSYITIDEWIALAEQRVGAELISSIASLNNPKSFHSLHATLPWLAPFADPSAPSSYLPVATVTQGLLTVYSPGVDYPTSFTYRIDSSGLTFSTTAPAISAAVMNSVVGADRVVSAAAGTCRWTSTGKRHAACKETITAGLPPSISKRVVELSVVALSTAKVTFGTATASAITTRNVARTTSTANDPFSFGSLFAITDYDAAGNIAASSEVTSGNASASVTGMSLPLNEMLPSWFAENRWQEVVYAAMAPNFSPGSPNVCSGACLKVGGRNDLHFLVLTAGPTLAALSQARPSPQLNNYLDSAENLNLDNLFTERISVRTPTYNDQIFTYP